MARLYFVRSFLLAAAAAALVDSGARAQPPAADPPPTLVSSLRRGYNDIKMNLTVLAGQLSEADYKYQVGTWDEQDKAQDTRTYAQLLLGLVHRNVEACAQIRDTADPHASVKLEDTAKTKAAIVKVLAESFVFCDAIFTNLTDQSAMQRSKRGTGESVAAAIASLVAHSNEHTWEMAWGARAPRTDVLWPARGRR